MGFFDFLNRQEWASARDVRSVPPLDLNVATGQSPDATSALETRSSTRIVRSLLERPKADRDRAWTRQFLAHVADAAFFAGEPAIVLGAERLPFFVLQSAGGAQAYPSHIIHHLKDDLLLDQGLGLVINPSGEDADWAFTYGDLLQFHLHGGFYPPEPGADPVPDPMPAQSRLPQVARKAIRSFLQDLGVAAPGVRFGARDHAGPGSLELVFRFSPQEFKGLDEFHFAMSNLAWFLPRNYSYSLAGNQAGQDPDFELL